MRRRRWIIEVEARLVDLITSSACLKSCSSSPRSSSSPPSSSSSLAVRSICSLTELSYWGMPFFSFRNSTIAAISSSATKAPWARTTFEVPGGVKSMSPRPMRVSAPLPSRMVRESTCEATWKAMREGRLALMTPVTTFTDGRWVAIMRWMPAARASWARRAMQVSISAGATIMRSASSSTMATI